MVTYFEDGEFQRQDKGEPVKIRVGDIVNDWGKFKVKVLRDRMVRHNRWSITHQVVFELNDKIYRVLHYVSATECQDEEMFDWMDKDSYIECEEVQPVTKLVTCYEPVKKVVDVKER